ncbi:hypothetical protein [Acidiplasma cupricumulans]|uniref:hypothetical protein n=1 Tax=Acidiplasma cupricumulans TaxID=312540 RepID=UPI000B1A5C96|nr:hypothetical protein [Acidiplasma cupricumulans]
MINRIKRDSKDDNIKNGNLLVKNNIRYGPAGGHGLDGFIIFPEKYQELRLSDLDINLKNNGTRYNFDLLVYLNNLRNTGDIIKYLALGADTIILNGGIFTDALNNNYSNLNEKALNFLIVIRRELALIAGAMGVSNLQYSVTGNRELMRGVNLDIDIESRIKVDEAGSL